MYVVRTESADGIQSDAGRVGHQAAAASWSLSEQMMLRDGDSAAAAGGGDWHRVSVVVVVGVAVVLAAVVVAVSALVIHTQRRLHGGGTTPRLDARHAAAASGAGPSSQRRNDDVEQVTTTYNYELRFDCDSTAVRLFIKQRRNTSVAATPLAPLVSSPTAVFCYYARSRRGAIVQRQLIPSFRALTQINIEI